MSQGARLMSKVFPEFAATAVSAVGVLLSKDDYSESAGGPKAGWAATSPQNPSLVGTCPMAGFSFSRTGSLGNVARRAH